jgi:chaperonin GroES
VAWAAWAAWAATSSRRPRRWLAEPQVTTAGGIILPENAKEKPQQAKVLAVGLGKLLDNGTRSKPDVAVGETILFGKYSGTELTVDGVDVIILRESDILAKLG